MTVVAQQDDLVVLYLGQLPAARVMICLGLPGAVKMDRVIVGIHDAQRAAFGPVRAVNDERNQVASAFVPHTRLLEQLQGEADAEQISLLIGELCQPGTARTRHANGIANVAQCIQRHAGRLDAKFLGKQLEGVSADGRMHRRRCSLAESEERGIPHAGEKLAVAWRLCGGFCAVADSGHRESEMAT
ncbi:hypothetical protein CXG43_13030 [Stenotrophomonas sp. Bg11-02]|nr:hypothetical protein CXF90_16815 [Stenotrophomonas sp. Betaine-02u-23]PKH95331.1 hypothetical protein CXG43_13030 [Stenotrophomonas sp. Bg11-02]